MKGHLDFNTPLKGFLEAAEENTKSLFKKNAPPMQILEGIDCIFRKSASNLNRTEAFVSSWFLFRSHSSFRGAVRLASAGQLPESYMVGRGCLEAAQYGLHIYENKEVAELWLQREKSKAHARKVINEFKKAIGTLRIKDPGLAATSSELYERTISMGAHPNPGSILSNMTQQVNEDGMSFSVHYMSDDGLALSMAHKTAAQIGIAALKTFYHVFKIRFDLLGIPQEIETWSRGL